MKTMNVIISTLLLSIIALKSSEISNVEYLTNNKQEIKYNNFEDFSDLDALLDDKSKHTVFLGGETHQIDCNSKIKFKLLKYLHQNAEVKYCLLELPHSFAWFYNSELKKDSISGWIENQEFFKNVYLYNRSLPEQDRIEFIGVDIERIHQQTIYVLYQLMQRNETIPSEIAKQNDDISSIYNEFMKDRILTDPINKNLRSLAYNLTKDIKINKTYYQKYLNEDFLHFDIIVNSLVNNFNARWGESKQLDNQQEVGEREKSMFKTFLKVYPTLEGNVFGQFGSMHVRQDTVGIERSGNEISSWSNPQTFAYNLNYNSQSPVKGKVLSIGFNYLNSFTSQQNRQYTEKKIEAKSILDSKTENEMVQASKSNFTSFKLTGIDSPYKELMKDFQYILLIQNQSAQKR